MRRNASATQTQIGFTLMELIVAVAILSILTTLAVPSYRTMMANNQGATNANALIQALTLARSEAIKRNRTVVVCKSTTGTSCDTSASVTWDRGLVTFVDANVNGALDSGEIVIRADYPFVKESAIYFPLSTNGLNSVSYSPSGLGSVASSTTGGTFTLRPNGSSGQDKTVILSSVGRPRIGP